MGILKDKHILLIIGGGIAAYKTPDLIRQLRAQGASVRCILTKGGAEFVTPLALASVSGEKIYQNLFDLTDEVEMGHIQLSRAADLVLVAPATADLIGKMAQGLANDLASTTLLATDKPVLIAPAMNVRMWHHPATQRNIQQLQSDGIGLLGPEIGDMACGEIGPGRMCEPATIVKSVMAFFAPQDLPLAGHTALVTAGPTYEPIDPVRYIANRSSGKQGYAIATEIAKLGAQTQLISGPAHLPDPQGVETKRVETAAQMLAACEAALPCNIAIMTAAVADWRITHAPNQKLKKSAKADPPHLSLTENPDILAHLGQHRHRPDLLIGFAAETDEVLASARAKRMRKNCDWMIANHVSSTNGVMGGDDNCVHVLSEETEETWEKMSKQAVAAKLAGRIATYFTTHPTDQTEEAHYGAD